MNVRASATRVLYEVIQNGKSLNDVLQTYFDQFNDVRDRSLLQAIAFGVCRSFQRLDAIARSLLERPFKERDLDLYILILVGLYQLTEMRIPAYASVAETVAAVKSLKKVWAKGLVNGVLREFQREAEHFKQSDSYIIQFSHPRWIIERIQKAYPNEWEKILKSNNAIAPLSLRVNLKLTTREDYLNKLTEQGIEASIIPETAAGISLKEPLDVRGLPGFNEGLFSVQDGAAQLVAPLMMLKPQLTVLDACAAPGGKTTHLLELEPSITCDAVDKDPDRLLLLKENLQRLKLTASCHAHDVELLDEAKFNQYDRILLDAPCSASGVIRRHPDIKLLRRESDLQNLMNTQKRLLNVLWQRLKPNGILLYTTCSVFPEENVEIIKAFCLDHADAKEEKINESWGMPCEIGRQILPGMQDMDGFYFARLRKQTS